MKISIRTKLVLEIFGIILLFVMIMLLLNSLLLKPYYKRVKEASLTEAYHEITSYDFDNSDISAKLEALEELRNIKILIIDDRHSVFFCSSSFMNSLFLPIGENSDVVEGEKWFRDWLLQSQGPESSVEIFSTQPRLGMRYNSENAASYLSLYAKASMDYNYSSRAFYIIINTPVAAIEDGVEAANDFALMVGMFVLIVGGIFTIIVGNRVVAPITRINSVSRKMAQLNFSEKLSIKTNDEFEQLAGSINNLSDQLESKIRELSVANYQLRKELIHKQRIDDMRREFISDVSHELKTPLSIILGYCEGIQMNINSEEKDYYCSVIEDEAIRMNNLAQRLLKLAELESGEVEPDMREFSLTGLVADRLGKLKYLLEERGITSSFSSQEDYYAYGDPERIEEVVNNILTNAKNHTPDNGRITVNITADDSAVRCEIYNSGSHIPDESLDKIWESFYKVDKARTRSYGGSGLGLKIVSTILQAHSADFGAKNTDDGVVFFFTLSRRQDISAEADGMPDEGN